MFAYFRSTNKMDCDPANDSRDLSEGIENEGK